MPPSPPFAWVLSAVPSRWQTEGLDRGWERTLGWMTRATSAVGDLLASGGARILVDETVEALPAHDHAVI